MRYKVVRCTNCAYFQVTGSSSSLKCLKCSKSKSLKLLKIYFSSDDAKECTLVLQELKRKQAEKLERPEGFFTYSNYK